MSAQSPAIVWFRQDLRLLDNPALTAAVATGQPVLPVYILDDESAGEWAMGGASRYWLHRSLQSLDESLAGRLLCRRGNAKDVLLALTDELDAVGVFWNRCYEPWRITRDTRLKAELTDRNRVAESFDGSLLFEPTRVLKKDGTPYKVFTPYFRKGCMVEAPPPRAPDVTGFDIKRCSDLGQSTKVESLELMPAIQWHKHMDSEWQPGEQGAQSRLEGFMAAGISNYETGRNHPDQASVSRLSPHLHFGELSPHQAWHAVQSLENDSTISADIDRFLSELGWREFSHYLLFHQPDLPRQNLQSKFDRFPWVDDPAGLKAWQEGMTGLPLVDAGMRELWRTGYMHNRVRMVTASFLVKNLLIHWHHGADWFWDTLLDADLANNSASWQWVAGCGADAAPFFRIFNPTTQGQKFDSTGDYVRRFVPELAQLPTKYIHRPFDAPDAMLDEAGVELDNTYPRPIIDLKSSREVALQAFRSIGQRAADPAA